MEIALDLLRSSIADLGRDSTVCVALQCPTKGVEFFRNAAFSLHPASTMKTCVMLEAFRRAELGSFDLHGSLPVVNQFPSLVDGSPFSLNREDDADPELYELIGERVKIGDLIERMIVRSSNLATNVLLEYLGAEATTKFMHELGTEGLVVKRGVEDHKAFALGLNNSATARALNTILLRLLAGEAVSPQSDQEMIQILLRQEHNQAIPRHLPQGTLVAHKTGWNRRLFHDSAIVFPVAGSPYVLTVMTQGLEEAKEGPDLVAEISRIVFEALA